jgi:hypothetical protein
MRKRETYFHAFELLQDINLKNNTYLITIIYLTEEYVI